MKAFQREPSSRLCKVASIAASAPRPMRRPLSRAAITLLSLTTSASPGASNSGRSRNVAVLKHPAPPGLTTNSRALSRGFAGRKRNAVSWQLEVEQIGAHGALPAPLAGMSGQEPTPPWSP